MRVKDIVSASKDGAKMNLNLKGKIALVGGASQGIGQAAAEELAALGARVILLSRSKDKLEQVAKGLSGSGHKILALDVSDRATLKSEVSHLLQEVGPIEILVCNTGGPKSGPIVNAAEEEFIAAFQNHVLVNNLLVQLLLPGMKERGYGRIVNVISTSVKIPIPGLGVSNTIRAAVANWAKSLSLEVASFGVTVNNVLPGYTETPRLDVIRKATADRLHSSEQAVSEDWLKATPAGRFGKPSEIAAGVAFLCSPAAAFINGINLPIDGGRTGSL